MKRLNGIQFRGAVEKAAYKIAADLNLVIGLMWKAGISTAAIDSTGVIYLSNVADDAVVTETLVWKYAGFILHELLHRKYTDFSHRDGRQYVDALHNAIEDAWIESRAIDNKLTGNCEKLLSVLVTDMVNDSLVQVKDWADPAQYPFALAVYCRDHAPNTPLADGLEPIFSEAKRRIGGCLTSAHTLDVAKWVFDQLQRLPKPDQNKGKDQRKDQGEGQGEGKGNAPQSPAEAPKSSDSAEGEGKGAPTNKTPAKPVESAATKARQVEPMLDGDNNGGAQGTYSTKYDVCSAGRHIGYNTRDISFAANARLRYDVKKLFENSANDEWQHNRRAGSLNVLALPKVGNSDRLFKRRLETEGVDSAVVILLDVSGSMFTARKLRDQNNCTVLDDNGGIVTYCFMDHAVKACAALLDTLSRAGVKVAIHTFGSDTAVFKPFDMPTPKAMQQLTRICAGGGTNDYSALRFAHEALHYRPEERKAVFVITDGIGDVDSTKAQVKAGEALNISTVGIGIAHDVAHIYPKSIRIDNATDLANASFKQIKLAA
jgi:Mg-chelatase subunit ChlD